MKRTRSLLCGAVALALVVAACGNDDDGATAPDPEPEATDAPADVDDADDDPVSDDDPVDDDPGAADTGDDDPILVGVVHDLSGPIGPFGNEMLVGAELAVQQFNDAGGFEGRPVELLVEDLESDRAVIGGAIRSLSGRGVVAIHGPTSSTAVVVGAPVAEAEGLVLLPPGSQEEFGDDILNDWIFRIAPVTAFALPGVLEQMQAVAPFERLAIFYDPANNASVDDANLLQELAPTAGFEVVAVETAEEGATEFSGQISNIAAADPDAIWMSHLVEENAGFLIQARERGIDAQFLGGTTFTNPQTFEIAAEAGEGALTYVPFFAGSTFPATAEFTEAFREYTGGDDPNSFYAYGYDGMWAILRAIETAGSTDREAIRDAMASLSFDGATGTITWDGPGDNQTPDVVLVRVEDRRFVEVAS